MRKSYFMFVVLLVTQLMLGCSFYRIDSQDTTLEFYEPKSSPEEVVYLENVDKPHVEIGTVYVTSERNQSFDEVLYMIKKEAAILGGDAITDVQSDATGIWKKYLKADLVKNAYVIATFSAKVVVYK